MEEKILESMVSGFTKTLIEESKKILDNFVGVTSDEIKQYIGKDLKNYLNKHQEKYSHIKTLLRGNTPVFLYDIYFPAKLIDENGEIISTDSIRLLTKKYKYLTIIGDAGSGKSTLVKHLFLNTILEKNSIPILVELRYLNDFDSSFSLESYIKEICNSNKLQSNENILERFLENGKFTFFLDGFDELDQKTKKKTVKQLNDFIEKYTKNSYILTSRPYTNIEHLPLFINLEMKELSLENGEIKGFVYKQLGNEKELAEKAVKSIEQGEIQYIQSF
ncbi:NACHT domain-containing protein [Epilithonimonas xixisoli]|uniref:NACHT domain-containing protein n=1 Tax=Epilithonimonas xixisoli TaxID=1476462 RepID=A0A4R8I9P7_9FLAO|nr:NACHT domain-containing protein [Epilithonimonas xixisoli]TDX86747.1 NACHT domain-containing protein [Epilithonimonas xixisoli]